MSKVNIKKEIKELREYMRTMMAEICNSDSEEEEIVERGINNSKKIADNIKESNNQLPLKGHLSRYFI